MKAGFYECDITPPLGTERPADLMKLLIEKISDPLKIRACILYDGTQKIALVGIDNVGVGEEFKNKVEAMLPEYNLIISASHTHYGGNLWDKIPEIASAPDEIRKFALEDRVAYDEVYYAFCLKQFVTAVKMADRDLTEVDFSFGSRRVENLIFNRRIRMKEGNVQTHPGKGNPDNLTYAGPVDDELGAVGIWKKNTDQLLGCLLNFSCHACINLEGATADFPGIAIDTVRKVYGHDIGVVYLNGASGDVTQIDNLSLRRDSGKDIAIKLGRVIGAKTIEILATADRGACSTLRCLSKQLPLKRNVHNILSEEEIAECWDIVRNNQPNDSMVYRAKSQIVDDFARRNEHKEAVENLKVLQIGPLVIGSSSGEPFAQYALDFKKASSFPFTWYSQLAHCDMGYVPTPDCFDESGGGYETSIAKYAPETGTEMIQILSELTAQLTPEEAPKPEEVAPTTTTWAYNFKK